jgi:hypothetical protein
MKRHCRRPAPESPPGAGAAREAIEAAIDAAQGELTRTRLAAYCDADPKARERLVASVADLEREVDALWARLAPQPAEAGGSHQATRKPARAGALKAARRRATHTNRKAAQRRPRRAHPG